MVPVGIWSCTLLLDLGIALEFVATLIHRGPS